jgi:hypothetical protein
VGSETNSNGESPDAGGKGQSAGGAGGSKSGPSASGGKGSSSGGSGTPATGTSAPGGTDSGTSTDDSTGVPLSKEPDDWDSIRSAIWAAKPNTVKNAITAWDCMFQALTNRAIEIESYAKAMTTGADAWHGPSADAFTKKVTALTDGLRALAETSKSNTYQNFWDTVSQIHNVVIWGQEWMTKVDDYFHDMLPWYNPIGWIDFKLKDAGAMHYYQQLMDAVQPVLKGMSNGYDVLRTRLPGPPAPGGKDDKNGPPGPEKPPPGPDLGKQISDILKGHNPTGLPNPFKSPSLGTPKTASFKAGLPDPGSVSTPHLPGWSGLPPATSGHSGTPPAIPGFGGLPPGGFDPNTKLASVDNPAFPGLGGPGAGFGAVPPNETGFAAGSAAGAATAAAAAMRGAGSASGVPGGGPGGSPTGYPGGYPMSPGAGMGGQQGAASERERAAWLPEDSGIWGAEESLPPAVLGRE